MSGRPLAPRNRRKVVGVKAVTKPAASKLDTVNTEPDPDPYPPIEGVNPLAPGSPDPNRILAKTHGVHIDALSTAAGQSEMLRSAINDGTYFNCDRIAVTGGRTFDDRVLLEAVLDLYQTSMDLLIVGDAEGVDTLAWNWATRTGTETKMHIADWKNKGKQAGHIRNGEMMLDNPRLLIAFEGGRGTESMIEGCLNRKKFPPGPIPVHKWRRIPGGLYQCTIVKMNAVGDRTLTVLETNFN